MKKTKIFFSGHLSTVLPCGHGIFFDHEQDTATGRFIAPDPGDVGVCSNCGAWWEFTGTSRIAYRPTAEEERLAAPFLTFGYRRTPNTKKAKVAIDALRRRRLPQ